MPTDCQRCLAKRHPLEFQERGPDNLLAAHAPAPFVLDGLDRQVAPEDVDDFIGQQVVCQRNAFVEVSTPNRVDARGKTESQILSIVDTAPVATGCCL